MSWKTSEEQAKARHAVLVDMFADAHSKRLPDAQMIEPMVTEGLVMLRARCKGLGLDPYYGNAAAALCMAEATCAMLEASVIAQAVLAGAADVSPEDELAVEIAEALGKALRTTVRQQYAGAREKMCLALIAAEEVKRGGRRMSWDVRIVTAEGERRVLPFKHGLRGGTYQVGGSNEAWLNITYNYGARYREIWGHSLDGLNGQTVAEASPKLVDAIRRLGRERGDDYWEATPGNAGAALFDLLALCAVCEPTDVLEVK